jgi:predicted secreted Zn-dependent protease
MERMLDPQQINAYSYTRNNPLNLVDVKGKQAKKPKVTIHKPVIKKTTYDVKGATVEEALGQSNKYKVAGETRGFAAATTPEFLSSWSYNRSVSRTKSGDYSATATIKEVEVKTTITVDTPKWVDSEKASQADQDTWNDFIKSTEEHEQGHVDIDTAAAAEIGEAIAGTPSVTATGKTPQEALAKAEAQLNAEAKKRANSAEENANKKNDDYDKETDHGRKKKQE